MNLHIEDSYKASLPEIRNKVAFYYNNGDLDHSRSQQSYIIEWVAHNWLYKHNLFKSHTKDVDLNSDESLFRRFSYFLIYILYFII